MLTKRLSALAGMLFLLGCSGAGEPAASGAGSQSPELALNGQGPTPGEDALLADAPARAAEGILLLTVASGVPSFLGAVHAVVTNATGRVLGGADEDVAEPELAPERSLELRLPVGEHYSVSLSASTTDAQPTTCTASIDVLDIHEGATAHAQVFSWDCGGVSGYVPSSVDADCYWLADWSLVTRTSAAIGELIDVSVAARGLDGNLPTFSWSTSAAGSFAEPAASQTSFRCQAAAQNLPLAIKLSVDGCEQQVTQTVSCR